MFIDIHDLEVRPLDFHEQYKPESLPFGPDVRQTKLLETSGRAELLEEHTGGRGKNIEDIRVVGSLKTQVEVACARCLDPVVRDISKQFDLLYRPQGADADQGEEISVTQAEAEVAYYIGDGLLLEEILREQVLLEVPIKTVCSDDCKGLCPTCGKNLNQGACDCKDERTDPRWDALKNLRDKL